MNNTQLYHMMFRNYPDVVDAETMRQMLGGIGRKTAYQILRNGDIESVRIGRAYRIAKIHIISYLCKNQMKLE